MSHYRCFFVDVQGHFRDVEEFASQGDDVAVLRAMSVAKANQFSDFELWQYDRLVASTRRKIERR